MAITTKDLGKAFKEGLSLLVGSGVSCACGLPSWQALINEMKKQMRACCPAAEKKELAAFFKTSNALAIAGAFKQGAPPVEYARFLRAHFRNRPVTIAPMLKSICRLPVRVIFTTNYDKLLETAFRKNAGEDPVVITNPKQLSSLATDEIRIVKIHGDIDYPDSIVLTDSDYADYDAKYASMRAYFQGQMAFNTLVLIGFGLKDPNFDHIFSGAKALVSEPGPRVIALMAKQNKFDVIRWEAKGLSINNFDTYDDIPKFLGNVLRHSK
jgi:hypothetical protein